MTWGLDLSKTAYPRRKFRTGAADWRWSDIKGLPDLKDVRAVRKNGASVRKDDMAEREKRQPHNHKESRVRRGPEWEESHGRAAVLGQASRESWMRPRLRPSCNFLEHKPPPPLQQERYLGTSRSSKHYVTGIKFYEDSHKLPRYLSILSLILLLDFTQVNKIGLSCLTLQFLPINPKLSKMSMHSCYRSTYVIRSRAGTVLIID